MFISFIVGYCTSHSQYDCYTSVATANTIANSSVIAENNGQHSSVEHRDYGFNQDSCFWPSSTANHFELGTTRAYDQSTTTNNGEKQVLTDDNRLSDTTDVQSTPAAASLVVYGTCSKLPPDINSSELAKPTPSMTTTTTTTTPITTSIGQDNQANFYDYNSSRQPELIDTSLLQSSGTAYSADIVVSHHQQQKQNRSPLRDKPSHLNANAVANGNAINTIEAIQQHQQQQPFVYPCADSELSGNFMVHPIASSSLSFENSTDGNRIDDHTSQLAAVHNDNAYYSSQRQPSQLIIEDQVGVFDLYNSNDKQLTDSNATTITTFEQQQQHHSSSSPIKFSSTSSSIQSSSTSSSSSSSNYNSYDNSQRTHDIKEATAWLAPSAGTMSSSSSSSSAVKHHSDYTNQNESSRYYDQQLLPPTDFMHGYNNLHTQRQTIRPTVKYHDYSSQIDSSSYNSNQQQSGSTDYFLPQGLALSQPLENPNQHVASTYQHNHHQHQNLSTNFNQHQAPQFPITY